MRSEPDGEYKWILQIRDHFSKYCALYPLKQKTAEEVAAAMLQWIHHYSVHPRIWQSDNGTEFKGALLILLRRYGVKVINSRPRYPQSQGLVEQANGFIKKKLYAVKQLSGTSRWAAACLIVAALINRTYHKSIGCTPFRCLYGRDP